MSTLTTTEQTNAAQAIAEQMHAAMRDLRDRSPDPTLAGTPNFQLRRRAAAGRGWAMEELRCRGEDDELAAQEALLADEIALFAKNLPRNVLDELKRRGIRLCRVEIKINPDGHRTHVRGQYF